MKNYWQSWTTVADPVLNNFISERVTVNSIDVECIYMPVMYERLAIPFSKLSTAGSQTFSVAVVKICLRALFQFQHRSIN